MRSFHNLLITGICLTIWGQTNLSAQENDFIALLPSLSENQNHFDEVYSADQKIRSPYQPYIKLAHGLSGESIKEFHSRSLEMFQGDNVLMHFPRLLTREENARLKSGTYQRARALQAFLMDHYRKDGKEPLYATQHVIPQEVVDSVVQRTHERGFQNLLSGAQISFWYGADLIRGPDGEFYALEDNPGFVGGFGDLQAAKKIFLTLQPELSELIDHSPVPESFFADLCQSYKKRAGSGRVAVNLQYPKAFFSDHEELRVQNNFAQCGIHSAASPHRGEGKKSYPKLIAEQEGLFLALRESDPRESWLQVGLLILNMETSDADPLQTPFAAQSVKRSVDDLQANFQKRLSKLSSRDQGKAPIKAKRLHARLRKVDKIKASLDQKPLQNALHKYKKLFRRDYQLLAKGGVYGVFASFMRDQVSLVNSPGIEMIGDKEFYIYVERLIHFYLNEEPIIKNLPAASFRVFHGNEKALDQDLYDYVFGSGCQHKDQLVLKKVDGRGGDGVWVGPKVSAADFCAQKHRVKQNPEMYTVQLYSPISQAFGHIVDLRVLADVSESGVVVAPIPWGRAVQAQGSNGKVNISDKGGETAVFVAK